LVALQVIFDGEGETKRRVSALTGFQRTMSRAIRLRKGRLKKKKPTGGARQMP